MSKAVYRSVLALLMAFIAFGVVFQLLMRSDTHENGDTAAKAPDSSPNTNPGNGISHDTPLHIDDFAHLDDDILKTIGLEPECAEPLNSVLFHDLKHAAKYDIPEMELKNTSSKELCRHFSRSPMRIWFGLYDDNRNMGITRALRASKTLGTLYSRDDIVEAILEVYNETHFDIHHTQENDPGLISVSLMITDEFLMYPPVFRKTQGYEKRLLTILCQRIKIMEKANSESPEPIYGAPYISGKELAFLLVERIDPNLYLSLKAEPNAITIFSRIENAILAK